MASVNRLNKIESFRDLKVLSFDFHTAAFSFAPGFNASITYSPVADSYEVFFFRDEHSAKSPHTPLAGLMSHRLNDLALAGRNGKTKGTVGQKFVGVSAAGTTSQS